MKSRNRTVQRLPVLFLALFVGLFVQLGIGPGLCPELLGGPSAVLAQDVTDVPSVPHDDEQPLAVAGAKPVKRASAPAVLLPLCLVLLALAVRAGPWVPARHRTGPAAVTPGAVLLTRLCVCRP